MRILFLFPNIDMCGYKPIPISQLVALLKARGHTVRIFDTSFYDTSDLVRNRFYVDNKIIGEQLLDFVPVDVSAYRLDKVRVEVDRVLADLLAEFKPELALASVLSPEALLCYHLLGVVKQYNPALPTLMGGKHCYADPEGAIANRNVDMICVGDGETPLTRLLERMSAGQPHHDIPGLWVKQPDGRVVRNDPVDYCTDLDALPYLDYDEYDERQLYRVFCGKVYRSADYIVTRGCYEKCGYCLTETANRYHHDRNLLRRCRSVERIIDELRHLKQRHRLDFIRFQDSSFLSVTVAWLKQFAGAYAREIGLPFCIDVSPQTVTAEKARLLKEMNCVSVSVGVESGNENLRYRILNKRVRDTVIVEAFRRLNRHRMRTVSFCLIGFPFETRRDIEDSIRLNRECAVTSPGISSFYPFKGTRLRTLALQHRLFDPALEPEGVPLFNRGTPLLTNHRITPEEYQGIIRTFILYSKLPETRFEQIRRAETNDEAGCAAFRELQDYYRENYLLPTTG